MSGPVKSVQWGKEIVRSIEIYPILGSTNHFARPFIKSGGASGTVLWALDQTDGVGRLGRSWDADASSLTFSLVWRSPNKMIPQNLTLAVGLGLVQSLEAILPTVKIKWPNDLWIGEQKLGGILTDTMRDQGQLWVILGVGLNINATPPQGDRSPRISLQEATGCSWSRLGILDLALSGVERGFALAQSRADLGNLFRKHGNFLDREITVVHGGQSFHALARDVLPDGRLLIEDACGVRALLPEEISVRF